jgi:acyl-CoA thioesterase
MSEIKQTKEIAAELVEKAREVFSKVPFIRLIGMELADLKDGEATVKLKMRDELRQPHGLLHGGATASVIDTAMAFAVVTKLSKEEKASTVDLNVYYLRPVKDGEITCTAKIVKAGKRLLTVSAEVFNDEGKLIATSLSTYSKV